MNLEVLEGPESTLENYSDDVEKWIRDELEELSKQNIDHEDVIYLQLMGRELFRLKIVDEEKGLNHRVIFDIVNGEIVVSNIFDRSEEEYHELELQF